MEFRGSRNPVRKEPQHRINELIRANTVRVVGEDIETGVYPLREALAMAEAAGADLVEISPNADHCSCFFQVKNSFCRKGRHKISQYFGRTGC